MAAQELLLFDAAPSLLGESSSSLFDCMDSETGVDDLLSASNDFEQASSPAPSQLMRPLTEGKTCIGSRSWEAVPNLGFNRISEPQELGPIRCMAHELELQAKRLEEQHALQTSDRLDCEAGSVAVYQTVKLEPASTGPQSTTSGSFSSAATMMKIPSKGDSKAKPKKFVSSAATVSLALKNSQGVSAGTGCLQPGAWRGCLKSSWCNRENRHRGLCNSRATIPGVDAYNQPAVPPVEPQLPLADVLAEQTLQTPIDVLTPTSETECQLDNDSEPGSCSDLDTYSVYPGSDPPPMVQQQELQPLVPCSSTSSDMGGRLSSLDISYKLEEQYDPDGNDHTADTNAFLASAIQYNSGTDYSDDEEDDANDSDDIDSICSASTLSVDDQDSMASDLVDSQFEETYSDGALVSSGGSGGPIRKQRPHGGRCVNAGYPGQACTQCNAQQTPVWRAGPKGPKTLCNACGVRWMKKSKGK